VGSGKVDGFVPRPQLVNLRIVYKACQLENSMPTRARRRPGRMRTKSITSRGFRPVPPNPETEHFFKYGWRVEGWGCRVQGAGCRVQGGGWMVQGAWCGFCCSGSRNPEPETADPNRETRRVRDGKPKAETE